MKQQQRERLEQLIDQLVQIADSGAWREPFLLARFLLAFLFYLVADRPDLLPCLHHVFAEVSLQRQKYVIHFTFSCFYLTAFL